MTAQAEAYAVRRSAALKALSAVRLDANGTPDRKLPNCPRCDEDELYPALNGDGFACYRCSWSCASGALKDGE